MDYPILRLLALACAGAGAVIVVALSLLTNDLLDDIGASDLTKSLPFVPSTEAFSLLDGDNSGNSAKAGDTLTVRGFKTDTRRRNFFQTLGFSDRYVADRVTFSRGPNALLFGIGNPGVAVPRVRP